MPNVAIAGVFHRFELKPVRTYVPSHIQNYHEIQQ